MIEILVREDAETCLRGQIIDETHPGPLVGDFNRVLKFIREHSPEVGKSQNFLATTALKALNAQMAHPLEVDLKRPVQKSYPHINGLYLLMRTSGLAWLDESGKKPRLKLDEELYRRWGALNPTEQYFNLLELWLLYADEEIIGERTFQHGFSILPFASRAIDERLAESRNINDMLYELKYGAGLHAFALMELAGFVSIRHDKPERGKGWRIQDVKTTRFFQAFMGVFTGFGAKPAERLSFHSLPLRDEEDETAFFQLGLWQDRFKPYFPEWRNNLEFPEAPDAQEGTFVFKVSLGKVWCRIALPDTATWEGFSNRILNAFEFDNDHLHQFLYKDRFGAKAYLNHSYMNEPPFTNQVTIGELPIMPGSTLTYVFDFGDNWEFKLLLEAVHPVDETLKAPKLLEMHGTPPRQYPDWDDEEYE